MSKGSPAEAVRAWAWVQEIKNKAQAQAKEYETLCRRLPSQLQSAGAAQCLAFLYSKAQGGENKAHALLLDQLLELLPDQPATRRGPAHRQQGMERFLQLEGEAYRDLGRSLRLHALWLKRWAEAVL